MNTARMDSLLSRQKKNLIADTLYALVVTIVMVISLLGLGIGTSPARVAEAPTLLAPAPIAQSAGQCTTSSAGETAALC